MDALYMLAFMLAVNALVFYTSTIKSRSKKVRRETLNQEIRELRVQAKRLESPATFAKSAKLVRQADAKEREVTALTTKTASDAEFIKGLQTVKFVVCGTLLYQWWGLPVVFIPSAKLGFMAERVQLPHSWDAMDSEVRVSILSWLLVCDTAANAVIAAADSLIDW